jgi:hypothetical protein
LLEEDRHLHKDSRILGLPNRALLAQTQDPWFSLTQTLVEGLSEQVLPTLLAQVFLPAVWHFLLEWMLFQTAQEVWYQLQLTNHHRLGSKQCLPFNNRREKYLSETEGPLASNFNHR